MDDVHRDKDFAYRKAYSKEVYNWRKAHKICVICGHEDAQKGYVSCLLCRMKQNEKSKKYNENLSTEQRYRKKQHKNRKNALLRAFGVCVQCGKRDAAPGKSLCPICLDIKRRQEKDRRIKQGGRTLEMIEYSEGCRFCGEPVMYEKKVCKKHFDILMANIEKAHSCFDSKHHPFRRDNKIAFGNYDRR